MTYDKIIIGAGLYGLYAARRCAERGEKVLVLEHDEQAFSRATYVNQARVHMGYHYPRSLTTALKSAGYYRRFHEDFGFAIHDGFEKIYATSAQFSWTGAEQFRDFCKAAGIRCEEIPVGRFFRSDMCDGAFLTEEDTYDATILRDFFLESLSGLHSCEIRYCIRNLSIRRAGEMYQIRYSQNGTEDTVCAPFVLNASYASVNQILTSAGQQPFEIKYELCEIILVEPSKQLRNVGLTVMDGPFFSVMPFGKTKYHSLTAVAFTPHVTSFDVLPTFHCQNGTECTNAELGNCNLCPNRPGSAWEYMAHLAGKYIRPEYGFTYHESLFSMKPILKSSEIDDSRPTVIRMDREDDIAPVLVSVLSGKINTVYDMDEVLDGA